MKVKLDALPVLPFELILSYLSLQDLIRVRQVSRKWCQTIDSFKVKRLCCSSRPIGFIFEKTRLVSGAFSQNFIVLPQFESFASFFHSFDQSFLSNLKSLRLCDLRLNSWNLKMFAQTLNSFAHLEQLDIIRCYPLEGEFELRLPKLKWVQLEHFGEIMHDFSKVNLIMTLDSPRLRKVRLCGCSRFLRLNIAHPESVERLMTDQTAHLTMCWKRWKSLKYLYIGGYPIDSTFLSGLNQLKELHLQKIHLSDHNVTQLFEQKQRYGRLDLKIYMCGCLLNAADDIRSLGHFSDLTAAENRIRLANEIPFRYQLNYLPIEPLDPRLAFNLLKIHADLRQISVTEPVRHIQRFLDFLKSSNQIVRLVFAGGQPQELFDRLPEYCAVQELMISSTAISNTMINTIPDLEFLFRLDDLLELDLGFLPCSIDAKFIRKVFEELPFVLQFKFRYLNKKIKIEIDHRKRFLICVDRKLTIATDLNSTIQLIKRTDRNWLQKTKNVLTDYLFRDS